MRRSGCLGELDNLLVAHEEQRSKIEASLRDRFDSCVNVDLMPPKRGTPVGTGP